MKNLVLSLLAVCALITVVGCSDSTPPPATTSSATMSSDTKDMGNHSSMTH